MTAASWLRQEKQAVLGPSQSQTGAGEAELVLDVPSGGEPGREGPGQRQTGLALQAPFLDRMGSAVQ